MCFIVDVEWPEELTASEDIICYKTVYREKPKFWKKNNRRGKYKSYYKGFKYRIGKRYKNVPLIKEAYGSTYIINKGYHSYIPSTYLPPLVGIGVACIIPAGSKYYVNPSGGEYVSSSIKLVGELK